MFQQMFVQFLKRTLHAVNINFILQVKFLIKTYLECACFVLFIVGYCKFLYQMAGIRKPAQKQRETNALWRFSLNHWKYLVLVLKQVKCIYNTKTYFLRLDLINRTSSSVRTIVSNFLDITISDTRYKNKTR